MDAVSASSSQEPVGSSPQKAAAFLAARAAGDLTDLTCPQLSPPFLAARAAGDLTDLACPQ
jgi:hypothetical protein